MSVEIGERLASLEGKMELSLINDTELKRSLHELKQGIGQRIEEHTSKIAVQEERINLMSKVGWAIFSTALGAIVLAVLGLIIKKQ